MTHNPTLDPARLLPSAHTQSPPRYGTATASDPRQARGVADILQKARYAHAPLNARAIRCPATGPSVILHPAAAIALARVDLAECLESLGLPGAARPRTDPRAQGGTQ